MADSKSVQASDVAAIQLSFRAAMAGAQDAKRILDRHFFVGRAGGLNSALYLAGLIDQQEYDACFDAINSLPPVIEPEPEAVKVCRSLVEDREAAGIDEKDADDPMAAIVRRARAVVG